MRIIGCLILCALIASCSNTGRYSQHSDSKPKTISRDIDFRDVQPKYEPYLAASMRPYTVLGKYYKPLTTGKGYVKQGIASWYGQKFHGHLTANGEVYNMFAMSAAHKTLPLPSIVKVTNIENGKIAVVRVNDRGPFHHNRIIDLSYAAAMKIGVLDTGTAHVKVEVMHVDQNGMLTVGNTPAPSASEIASAKADNQLFIQVAALQDATKVQALAQGLQSQYQVSVNTPNENGLFRLHLGPLDDENHAEQLLQQLKLDGYNSAFRIYSQTTMTP
ncbi:MULTISPECIES: septal ring lytic transglycosylase RlpA family protein [Alteromonadaceae]|uniref:septal ring lytic transglycosylase RlpA family protein n=1 Tax=Alteromonadaceae TaxID=72275 RepID=UPI001C0A643E|nr:MULTISPECIES: septal ring lytic transglycosylase RlpA family protein [Aliiglaciecola]MBU2876184.1 septal ring lytic transglycosylase RlpA family protein [Aliiglaciecola lipolytica]MDO6710400.1 septal ring lytic transglycosylase RlpA family protein [Aliiglaciecola sp. 2_MG-2023]MDO6751735.1 septal ring lytic transglycosylase RlpA family protein [Aliiglaciecola sp. 1_MG-2023]